MFFDGWHIDEVETQHHVDVLLVVGVVFGVMAESIDIGIVEVFGFGNLQHLVAFSGVEEFALLVEEFEGVPMTGVVAGGDDDAATGAFHRYRNFGG